MLCVFSQANVDPAPGIGLTPPLENLSSSSALKSAYALRIRSSLPAASLPHRRSTNFLITSRFDEPFNSLNSPSLAAKPLAARAEQNEAMTSPLFSIIVPPISKITSLTLRIVHTYYASKSTEFFRFACCAKESLPSPYRCYPQTVIAMFSVIESITMGKEKFVHQPCAKSFLIVL